MRDRSRTAKALAAVLVLATLAGACAQTGAARPPVSHRSTSSPSAGRATEAFGLALMRRLPAGNLVFSPDSVAAALAMTGTGAAGDTATQIAGALRVGSPASFAELGRLQQTIAAEQGTVAHGSSEAPTLSIANGLFVQQGFALAAPFTAGLMQSFGASPQLVDFTGHSAVEAINAWVAQQTRGLIAQIVDELSPETRLALANAIYLKATWSEEFKAGETRPAPFHGAGAPSSTAFMHETAPLLYARGHGYVALSLPYRDSTLSLLVVLPVGESLRKFERRLDANTLERIVRALKQRPVKVSLPRFHLQTTATLNTPLQQLGITDAFSRGGADFSRITNSEQLVVGQVLHAADFKVDERGTEAAAATLVTVEALSAVTYRHVASFNADRPFMFLLRDDRSGAVLFAGRLVKP